MSKRRGTNALALDQESELTLGPHVATAFAGASEETVYELGDELSMFRSEMDRRAAWNGTERG